MPKKKKKLWFPTLLQSSYSKYIPNDAWYDMYIVQSDKITETIQKHIKTTYIATKKYLVYPTKEQHIILQKWFKSVIDMYNITNTHIKSRYESTKKIDSFPTIRKELLEFAKKIVDDTKINKHILDYSVKHCYNMYKIAITNLKQGNIKKFDIKNLSYDKNRYQLVLEKESFSKKINGFCVKELGEMGSQIPLDKKHIKKESILQYNRHTKKYYIIIPTDKKYDSIMQKEEKCGIDMGVRTFATIYSNNQVIEVGKKIVDDIDKYNNRIDKLNESRNKKFISVKMYDKVIYKYGNRMRNKIDDMHKKLSVFLCKKFETINLEKVSIKSMVSNLSSNLVDKTKRRLAALSIYKFYDRINIIKDKYGSKVNMINCYRTSKNCHSCGNTKENLGSSKIYRCDKCKIELDRDINAAMNMYQGGITC